MIEPRQIRRKPDDATGGVFDAERVDLLGILAAQLQFCVLTSKSQSTDFARIEHDVPVTFWWDFGDGGPYLGNRMPTGGLFYSGFAGSSKQEWISINCIQLRILEHGSVHRGPARFKRFAQRL